jgi:hypothetical protein
MIFFLPGYFMRPESRVEFVDRKQHRVLLLCICGNGNDIATRLAIKSDRRGRVDQDATARFYKLKSCVRENAAGFAGVCSVPADDERSLDPDRRRKKLKPNSSQTSDGVLVANRSSRSPFC